MKPEARISGDNIVYETHIYNTQSQFEEFWKSTARQLPVIIGEFGPWNEPGTFMFEPDVKALMAEAEAMEVPYLAFSFHQIARQLDQGNRCRLRRGHAARADRLW